MSPDPRPTDPIECFYPEIAYAELLTGACPDGLKHRIHFNYTGGGPAVRCVRCHAYTETLPGESQ
jgi:hypothetical protein